MAFGRIWRAARSTPPRATTDAQWAVIAPLLPPAGNSAGRGGGGEKWPRRLVVDAIFYLVKGGIVWRELPREFPPKSTVWEIYTRWVRSGAWERVHDGLRDLVRVRAGRSALPSAAIIDSQSVRGAATVGAATRGFDAGKRVNGRKRHIAVDTSGLLIAVIVTAASIQDRDGGARLLAAVREKFSTITLAWADAGYAGRLVGWAKQVLEVAVVVVRRADDQVGFKVRPPPLGRRAHLGVDQHLPPVRARVRTPPRHLTSHGPQPP